MAISEKLLKSIDEFQRFTQVNVTQFAGIIDGDGVLAILLRKDEITGELYIPKMIKTENGFKIVNEN